MNYILYIEDNPGDIELLREELPDKIIKIANSTDTAITIIEEFGMPQLILVDVNMSPENGHEVIFNLSQKIEQFHKLKILYVSSSSLSTDKCIAMCNGARAMLVKPITALEVENFLH